MTDRIRRRLPLGLALVLLAACTRGPTDPGSFTLDGDWRGESGAYELLLALDQDDENDVSGTGELRTESGTVELTVHGDWAHPTFELLLTAEGFADARYAGSWARSDSIAGTLSGSGFSSLQLSIKRQSAD